MGKAFAFNVHLRNNHGQLCGGCRQEDSGYFLQSLIPLQFLSLGLVRVFEQIVFF